MSEIRLNGTIMKEDDDIVLYNDIDNSDTVLRNNNATPIKLNSFNSNDQLNIPSISFKSGNSSKRVYPYENMEPIIPECIQSPSNDIDKILPLREEVEVEISFYQPANMTQTQSKSIWALPPPMLPMANGQSNNWQPVWQQESMNTERSNIIFDSIEIYFSLRVFLIQLMIHIFQPCLNCFTNVKAQVLWTWDPPLALIFGNMPFMVLYIMIVTYAISPDRDTLFPDAIFFPSFLYILHKIVIATKYATLHPSEYKRFMSSFNTSEYRDQIELLSGWYQQHTQVLQFEMNAAFLRAGLNRKCRISMQVRIGPLLDRCSLCGNPSQREEQEEEDDYTNLLQWINFFRHYKVYGTDNVEEILKHIIQQPNIRSKSKIGSYICLTDIFTFIIKYNANRYYAANYVDTFTFCMIGLMLIAMYRPLILTRFHITAGSTLLFYITATMIIVLYLRIIMFFLYVGIFDVWRQYYMLSTLSDLCKTHDIALSQTDIETQNKLNTQQATHVKFFTSKSKKANEPSSPSATGPTVTSHSILNDLIERLDSVPTTMPKLKLNLPENVLGWVHLRMLLDNFGHRFRFRLTIYVTIIIFVAAVLIAISIARIVTAADHAKEMSSIFSLQAIILITFVFVFVTLLTHLGTKVNEMMEQHKVSLVQHQLRNQYQLLDFQAHKRDLHFRLQELYVRQGNVGKVQKHPSSSFRRDSQLPKVDKLVMVNESISSSTSHPSTEDNGGKEIDHLEGELASLKYEMQVLNDCNLVINNCVSTIAICNQHLPYRVLGIPAQSAITTTIFTVAVSFYSTLLKLYKDQLGSTAL